MVIVLILIALIAVVFLLRLRDKRYEKAPLKEVMSDAMKQELKLKGTDERFEQQFEKATHSSKNSVKLLKELNKN